ncbi:hypothetical protein [Rhizosphaericola mali]|uniref:Uncharacterized protein n=1 Tax=Rhizosphaericola mali TaxID=2545455 RepID=A0A5P2FV46_9BACT|nr:hypothetical protein [Rhizosphaericola mali]QES87356.1 hypothetical protein E0W69_001335 [Rhizosphaericola mali]
MKIEKNFKILFQTSDFLLGNIYENVFLIKTQSNEEFYIGNFYGEPSFGIIDEVYKKCIVGGEKIINYDIFSTIKSEFELDNFAYDFKYINEAEYEILTDPWNEKSAIWRFHLVSETLFKVSNFTKYQNKEYVERIKW